MFLVKWLTGTREQSPNHEHLVKDFEKWVDKRREESEYLIFSARFENEVIFAEASSFSKPFVVTVYHKKLLLKETTEETNETCCICLDPIKKKHSQTIHCNHHFHTKCINETIKHNEENDIVTQCPLCRQGPITNIKELICYKNDVWERNHSDSDSDYDEY